MIAVPQFMSSSYWVLNVVEFVLLQHPQMPFCVYHITIKPFYFTHFRTRAFNALQLRDFLTITLSDH